MRPLHASFWSGDYVRVVEGECHNKASHSCFVRIVDASLSNEADTRLRSTYRTKAKIHLSTTVTTTTSSAFRDRLIFTNCEWKIALQPNSNRRNYVQLRAECISANQYYRAAIVSAGKCSFAQTRAWSACSYLAATIRPNLFDKLELGNRFVVFFHSNWE